MALGWKRQGFEAALRLSTEQCVRDEWGHYTDELTKKLWEAFKAGMAFTPTKGSFVVARMRDGLPVFENRPIVFDFKDDARAFQKKLALESGSVCVTYQQISSYNPNRGA